MPYEHIRPLGDDWKNAVISEATVKPKDLIVTFLSFLKDYAEPTFNDVSIEWEDVIRPLVGFDEERDYEQESELLAHLFDVMDAIAPEGCIFGSLEGDGACFGFWEFVDA